MNQQLLQLAIQHHQAGNLAQAEPLYREVLLSDPNQPTALNLLGTLLAQLGKIDEGVELLRRALRAKSRYFQAHYNLAEVLRKAGRVEEALAEYREALLINPASAETYLGMGDAFSQSGRIDEAIAEYQRAVSTNPQHSAAWSRLAALWCDKDETQKALDAAQHALAINPGDAEAHRAMGDALVRSEQFAQAIQPYAKAIQLRADYVEALSNLGYALVQLNRLDDAVAVYRRVVQLRPNDPVSMTNLSVPLLHRGDFVEAFDWYERAILASGTPDVVDALNVASGRILKDSGYTEEALRVFRRVLEISPNRVVHQNYLLTLNYSENRSPQELFDEHVRWAEQWATPLAHLIKPHDNDRSPERRLRVGYVSPDFRTHSVSYFLEPLLSNHDKQKVEVFCYSSRGKDDHVTDRYKEYADHWREIADLEDAQAADLIRQDKIDILVDLAGHTGKNRLLVFACKPAPLQVTYLGYPNTTGLRTIDYRFGDVVADEPSKSETIYVEKIIPLPTAWCYRPTTQAPEVSPPPFEFTGHVTLGSFNTVAKVGPQTMQLWGRVLQALPNARLLIKTNRLSNDAQVHSLKRRMAEHGVPTERIIVHKNEPELEKHLARYGEIDIALDAFPYNGTTTTCEALWMGVPVIALEGNTHVSRVSAAILKHLGLGELVANSLDEYVEIAVALAKDPKRMKQLRATMRERMRSSPLMDEQSFARSVEASYREIWRKWCNA